MPSHISPPPYIRPPHRSHIGRGAYTRGITVEECRVQPEDYAKNVEIDVMRVRALPIRARPLDSI